MKSNAIEEILRRLDAIEAKVNIQEKSSCCGGDRPTGASAAVRLGEVETFPVTDGLFLNVQKYSLPDLDVKDSDYRATATWLTDKDGNALSRKRCDCSGKNCSGSAHCGEDEEFIACNCDNCTVYCGK